MGRAIGAVYDEVALDHMKADLDLMDEITQHIPDVGMFDTLNTVTPDGNILWFCAEHRKQYEAKPFVI
jgi:hypothetical protein